MPPETTNTLIVDVLTHADKGIVPVMALAYWWVNRKFSAIKTFNDTRFEALRVALCKKIDDLASSMVTPEVCKLKHDGFERVLAAKLEPIKQRLDTLTNGGGVQSLSDRLARAEATIEGMQPK